MKRIVPISAAVITIALIAWLTWDWWIHRNPYEADGLRTEWSFGGATSTVPGLDIWAEYQGQRIDCPVAFGGLDNPELHFYDYGGDQRPDIVFENSKHKVVVSFMPAQGDSPPQFKVLRNDVYWP